MNCPNCGADLPDGTSFCSICQQPVAMQGGYVNNQMFNTAPIYAPEPKKKAPVLGIVIGAVALIAVAFVLVYFVLGARYNGTYTLESMSYSGITIDAASLSDYGMGEVGLKVSFGKCELVGDSELGLDEIGESKIKFSGDTVTIIDSDGTELEGEVDGNSLIFNSSGVEMTFSK